MLTAFDFDEYWDQFTQSTNCPEICDPVSDILYPDPQDDLPGDDWTLPF